MQICRLCYKKLKIFPMYSFSTFPRMKLQDRLLRVMGEIMGLVFEEIEFCCIINNIDINTEHNISQRPDLWDKQ